MGESMKRARRAASKSYGLIDRRTALSLGLTDSSAYRRVSKGELDRLAPGVLYTNATPPGWRTRVRGATLAAGPNSLASHRTAAVLYELEGVRGRMIELTVPYANQPFPDDAIVHRTRRLLPSDTVAGIPVTTVERTLLDLASLLPDITLEKAMMSAIRKELTAPHQIGELIAEQGGRGVRGTKRARRVLALTDDGVTGSPSEVDTLELIRQAPVPMPLCQYEIDLPGGLHVYPDFAWPLEMKLVEVDGLDAHGSADRLHNDLQRQNLLMELGWEIRRFSARAVRRDPQRVIAEIVTFINA